MYNRDWSLVFFTSLAQWSVGIALWLSWPVIYNRGLIPIFETDLSVTNPLLLAVVFIGVATLSSFLHLGKPANAPRALNNLASSWLSREILAIGVFSTSLVITLLLSWKTGSAQYLKPLMLLCSISGLALLWTMSRIYVMPTIPAWNSWHTPLSFVSTALSLGVITLLVLHANEAITIAAHIIRIFYISLSAILLTEIITGGIHQYRLATMDQGMEKRIFDKGAFYRVFLVRMAILIFAFQLAMVLFLKPDLLPGNNSTLWMSLLFILVIAQEVIGRLLFYSSYFRIGV